MAAPGVGSRPASSAARAGLALSPARHVCDDFDLDANLWRSEAIDDDAGVRRPVIAKECETLGRDARTVGAINEDGVDLDDVRRRRAAMREDAADVDVDLARLQRRVPEADPVTCVVLGDLSREEEEIAGARDMMIVRRARNTGRVSRGATWSIVRGFVR